MLFHQDMYTAHVKNYISFYCAISMGNAELNMHNGRLMIGWEEEAHSSTPHITNRMESIIAEAIAKLY